MKNLQGSVLAALILSVDAVVYGPGNCVTLSQSSTGSCVITTDCEGQDVSKFEFAFNCDNGDKVERHSFGVGGFDDYEEYDTQVKCSHCAAPSTAQSKASTDHSKKASMSLTQVRSGNVITGAKKKLKKFWPFSRSEARETEEPEAIVRFGPDQCVSTYRSAEGNCILKTECAEAEVSNYNFGLVCVDKIGRPTRHLFGEGSFDPSETFDTLIKCNECLGLEDVPSLVSANGQVMILSNEIRQLDLKMFNLTKDVSRLKEEFMVRGVAAEGASSPQSPSPNPALNPAPVPAPAPLTPFELADTNHDGVVEESEWAAASGRSLIAHQPPRHTRRQLAAISEDDMEVQRYQQTRHLRHHRHRGNLRRHEDEEVNDKEDDDEDDRRYRSLHGHHRKRHYHEDEDSDSNADNDQDSGNEAQTRDDEDSEIETQARDDRDDEGQEPVESADENDSNAGMQPGNQGAAIADTTEAEDGDNN